MIKYIRLVLKFMTSQTGKHMLPNISRSNSNQTLEFGIYNFGLTKPSYKTELQIMTSETELLTLKFYFIF